MPAPELFSDAVAYAKLHEFCTVIPAPDDLRRCEAMATLGRFKRDDAAARCAILIEAARRVAASTSGHLALDVIASVLPARFVENWARKRLGLVA